MRGGQETDSPPLLDLRRRMRISSEGRDFLSFRSLPGSANSSAAGSGNSTDVHSAMRLAPA
jgi:hypothetical protein